MPILDPLTPQPHLHAFAGFGIELEYMIVDRESLAVRPLAEHLLVDESGDVVNEVVHGSVAWSNELVAHVIELKTNGPAGSLGGLSRQFETSVAQINQRLAACGAILLPTAMHPLFVPHDETVLWSHGQNEIYATYDRIFGCRGHGWSNLQSMHINLPFANDEEFRRLHAAIRVVLPLLPAIAASSPLEEGRLSGWVDRRLFHYRHNQASIPQIGGLGVPEAVAGIDDYRQRILQPMYAATRPHDPQGILADDWLNSRGAIARFERQTIEIRLIDVQECPDADLGIAEAVVRLVKRLFEADEVGYARQQALDTRCLSSILFSVAAEGGKTLVDDADYLAVLGMDQPMSALEIWRSLMAEGLMSGSCYAGVLETLLERGCLSEAVMRRIGDEPRRPEIIHCYRELAQCLRDNRLFHP